MHKRCCCSIKDHMFSPLRKTVFPKTMPSTRTLSGRTNKGETLGFHPKNDESVLQGAPPTKKSSTAAAPTCGGYYYKSRTTRLTGTHARSGREHIPQAKTEQMPVKQSLHRLQDSPSPLAGHPIMPWHSLHVLKPWKS